ncbi:hypothetical protein AB0C71_38085 [Streptomyces anulatus]|uniref:hypothetical protein n=1 Tax=Streptomyces anulatus TaxID=1892 RepID=UPI0033E7F935
MDSKTLAGSAQRWMNSGLDAFARNTDLDIAVHHFGVATEHALKALLSKYHPALIVDANHVPSLLHATGNDVLTSTPRTEVKTITAMEAFKRCRDHVLKTSLMAVREDSFRGLLNARNGVSHVGIHDASEARKHLITAIRVMDPLLGALEMDTRQFWGGYQALHDELLQERADDLKLAYMVKIAHAKNVLTARLGPDLDLEDLVRARASSLWIDTDEEPTKCPACGAQGLLAGLHSIEQEDEAPGREEDDPVEGEDDLWAVMLYPTVFTCSICRLRLELDEFDLAGLPREVRTSHDPYEWGMPDPDTLHDDR